MWRLPAFVVAVVAVGMVFAQEMQGEKVVVITRDRSGRISKQKWDFVSKETYYRVAGGIRISKSNVQAVEVDGWQVVEIKRPRSQMSPSFASAEKARSDNNWAAAKTLYEQAYQKADAKHAWEKPYAAYWKAFCMFAAGDLKGAEKAYKAFVSEFSDHLLLPRALNDLGRVQMLEGKNKDAARTFKKLATERGFGRYWNVIGTYWQGEISYREGNLREAQSIWNRIRSEAETMGLQHVPAKYDLVRAEAYLKDRRYTEAKRQFEKVLERPTAQMDPIAAVSIMAKALMGHAACIEAQAAGDKGKLYEAYYDYLKVIALYRGARKEYKQALTKALAILDQLLRLTSDSAEKKDLESMKASLRAEKASVR